MEARESLNKQFHAYLEKAARDIGSIHASLYQCFISLRPFKETLERGEVVLMNRICCNHYNLNFSLYCKNIVSSGACPCGDSSQDINYIIFFCPITTLKSSHLKTFFVKTYSYLIDIFPWLVNPHPKLILLLLAYFKANDIYIWFSRFFLPCAYSCGHPWGTHLTLL